ncbi:class I SAM-dependent DNA methyltransferase [Gallaecimonas xiamenensis]|uniref:SAM-dependent methyltransferase n=1 Tax=Gallaecimonas xiamenensis 3-C-1 TaxID=745411 RepID=K2JWD9_9GAMM|nr:class I SAM-dependent methyltransferase [Gallaecimonas xiamenensis]EKE69550.1 SAM-dependent methyltransferase [Gallaecimonas xiamenensis 3-C-1]
MSRTALYTDLSGYYDLMCADINYQAQSQSLQRLHQIFGNRGTRHLDLACGTGPHVRHFLDAGFDSSGLDINQPMLDLAAKRCPEARFTLQNMCDFEVDAPLDLITCFLYSLHYCDGLANLKACIGRVHQALGSGGVFSFNAVDRLKIDNSSSVSHSASQDDALFWFRSGWHYGGEGERQSLRLHIERHHQGDIEFWQDEHPMVAVTFAELEALLDPLFEVHIFEHDYDKILPWDQASGNAIFVCVKR